MEQRLLNLQTTDYEHPFDKQALNAMRSLPMFDSVVNFVLNWTSIKWRMIDLCGGSFHVTPKSCPELFGLVRDVAKILEVDHLPEIYTEWSYNVNAYTTGYKNDTILVLYTGAVDLLSDAELKYIVGHEIGHIKSGHVIYHIMAQYFAQIISEMQLLGKFVVPIQLALMYWNRMSEFTADRAGLLACQNLDATLSTIMKMAGVPRKYFNTADAHVFAEQAQEFLTRYGDTTNQIIKNISVLDNTHPWTVLRAAELIKWVESGEYERLLNKTAGITCPACGHQVPLGTMKCPVCGNTRF